MTTIILAKATFLTIDDDGLILKKTVEIESGRGVVAQSWQVVGYAARQRNGAIIDPFVADGRASGPTCEYCGGPLSAENVTLCRRCIYEEAD